MRHRIPKCYSICNLTLYATRKRRATGSYAS